MIDVTDSLLSNLVDDLVEMHNAGGIELELWDTAYELVKHFYNTQDLIQIIIGEKK
jgi:hypothetical protein